MPPQVVILESPTALAIMAAKVISDTIAQAADARGRCTIALAGGSTPRAAYELLARQPELPWGNVHIFWGDERMVPFAHPDSNAHMAAEALLRHVPIPEAQIHRVPTELGDPSSVAATYEATIREVFELGEDRHPTFDLVLLGLGDDAHTASLFPGTAALDEQIRTVVANEVPKLNTWRITLTAPAINAASKIVLMVAGRTKAEAVRSVLRGERDPARYPAQLLAPSESRELWLLDREAAARLG